MGKMFCCVFYVFSFTAGVYVGPLNLIASIPHPSILTLENAKVNVGQFFFSIVTKQIMASFIVTKIILCL